MPEFHLHQLPLVQILQALNQGTGFDRRNYSTGMTDPDFQAILEAGPGRRLGDV